MAVCLPVSSSTSFYVYFVCFYVRQALLLSTLRRLFPPLDWTTELVVYRCPPSLGTTGPTLWSSSRPLTCTTHTRGEGCLAASLSTPYDGLRLQQSMAAAAAMVVILERSRERYETGEKYHAIF